MFRKSYWKKRFAPVLAGALVISSLLVPPGHAFAADPVTSEEQTVSPETPEVKDVTDSTDAATTGANLTTPDSVSDSVSDSVAATSATDASSGKEAAKQDVKETKEVKATDDAVTDPIPDKTPHLVYGDKSLVDEDAFVLLIFGDGFTASEQDSFYTNAQNTADYLMDTSPWDEFKDTIKIYALGVVSNESGAKADTAINQEQANADTRDTYFGSSFWSGGMQRLLTISSDGSKKAKQLSDQYLPAADFNIVIVNATTYGGSGGDVCVASLNNESLEMMLHELGHTTAKLSDEYFAGASYAAEMPNMTAESDPAKVRWSRFIGKNGVGVYEYDNGGNGWYRPHQNCKMRFLGKQYAFCEVCKEQIRKTFCQDSNVTKLFFQPYADMFYESDTGKDMREYFILRRGKNEITGDKLGDALTLTYKDANGNVVSGIPDKAGTYTIEATFAGDSTYEKCSQTASYTIELPDLITLDVPSKVYDGKPADLNYTVNYDKDYTVKAHYKGTVPYAAEITYDYDSDEAPVTPGRYSVTLTAYDKATGTAISSKTKDYEITFKSTTLQNNDTADYPGAMPYYNNKTIVFSGEGYTAGDQSQFEDVAKDFVKYFRSTEPFKEADTYFNYHTVETVSNESGIGQKAKDTYYKLTYDKNGKIVPTDESTAGAMYIGNNVITSYYKANIVIVNDKNVKTGTTFKNKRFTIYTTADEAGMQFAANELRNYFTNHEEGYTPSTDAEKDAERTEFLKALYYTWYGSDYAPVLSRAYDETFTENGSPIDLAPYFHTYVLGKEVEGVAYKMTYYADDNGAVGEELSEVPSKAGTYHAKAELVMDDVSAYGEPCKKVTLDGETYSLPLARGWTTYTIQAKDDPENPNPENPDPENPDKPDPGTPDDPKNPGSNNPGQNLKPNQNLNNNKNTTKNININKSTNGKAANKAAARTGDQSPVWMYTLLSLAALAVIAAVICKRRFRR